MNRDSIWLVAREKAILDRGEFLSAWEGCDPEVIAKTEQEIARFNKLKGKNFQESLGDDREGVRLALLSAEIWFQGLSPAQVGREQKRAAGWYKRIHDLRVRLFGYTRLETALRNSVATPINSL